jgi:hypothetical protein
MCLSTVFFLISGHKDVFVTNNSLKNLALKDQSNFLIGLEWKNIANK